MLYVAPFTKNFCLSILYRKGSEIVDIEIFDAYPDVLDVVIISARLKSMNSFTTRRLRDF